MTTRQEISDWFDRGTADKKAYMVVWVDEYDYEDYPDYHDTEESAQFAIDHPGSMQRVMEVYDLSKPSRTQLNRTRAWALKPSR